MDTIRMRNGDAIDRSQLPLLGVEEFREAVIAGVENGARVAALLGLPRGPNVQLIAILAHDRQGGLSAASTEVGDEYPSITPDCPQAHWFEREIAEQWGVRPLGHPQLKPIRFHASYRRGHDAWGRLGGREIKPCVIGDNAAPGMAGFFRVEGSEVHEVAVGPVHAGVIEPGHFRFQCHGEIVHHLEILLGYQHRGIEPRLVGGPDKRTLHYIETIAGDTTIGHASAYCQAVEALADVQASPRAMALRGVALELERIANHAGDLGALAGDVGFLPTASYCGRIRGDVLNATAWICGNRFGRGLVRPGGVAMDIDDKVVAHLLARLEEIGKDLHSAVNLLWETPSVTARFEDTGAISLDACREMGLVGPAARACGAEIDVRSDLPFGIYRFANIPASTWHTGDVFARAYVRWLEIHRSLAFIREQLESLPSGAVTGGKCRLAAGQMVVSMTEGWRGEICHVALTDAKGSFERYKVVDPSFHNWFGLAYALRGQQISDFPLCNKSFNLSYCGHDL